MLFFSGCKINLGLRIVRKRHDGFHDIETVFYPVGWKDAIEFLPGHETNIEILGRTFDGNASDNYVLRAYNALAKKHPLPKLHFKLLKNVPAGAGLGGGSANAALTLKQLNDSFEIGLVENELSELTQSIGSDCAFFLRGVPCLATGRGEKLEPVEVDLSGYWLFVLFPEIHVNTAWAYKTFAQRGRYYNSEIPLTEIIHQGVDAWKVGLINDFEDVVFDVHPALEKIKTDLYENGAVYASLSGSGSALFGWFEQKPDGAMLCKTLGIKPENHWLEPGRRFGL